MADAKIVLASHNKGKLKELREIKRRLRAAMTGVLSGTMRKNGVAFSASRGWSTPKFTR